MFADVETNAYNAHPVIGAVFKIRPVSLFAWRFGRGPLLESNFLFAKDSLTGMIPPAGGVITAEMVGTPIAPAVPSSSGAQAIDTAVPPEAAIGPAPASNCPPGLPADAIKERCDEQAALVPAGL